MEYEKYKISPNDLVTVTDMGHLKEVQYMQKMNREQHVQKINADEYVVLETGEVKKFKKTDNRSESYNSLRKTFKKIRYLINSNFKGSKNELFLTLTYRENMTDTKKLYLDLDKFIKKLRYRFKNKSTVDYMTIVEPQERGAWHTHTLLKFNDLNSVFIPSDDLEELWGHGFIKIKRINDVDNIGAYLSAYLTDLELTDENLFDVLHKGLKVEEKEVKGVKKKFVKGGRLHLYPSGMNLYRKSKGIKFPEREVMTYKKFKEKAGSTEPHFSKTYEIDVDDFKNTIAFEQYNLKRN